MLAFALRAATAALRSAAALSISGCVVADLPTSTAFARAAVTAFAVDVV